MAFSCVFILTLCSDLVKKVLLTRFVQFLGKISYTFYLSHTLILFGPQREFYRWITKDGNVSEHPYMTWLCYVVITPFQFFVAALLEKVLDDPGKNFANDLIKLISKKIDRESFWKTNKFRFLGATIWFVVAYASVQIFHPDYVKLHL